MPDEGYFLFASRRLRELCEAERRFLALMRGESKPEQYIRRTSVTPEGAIRPESSGVHLRSRSRSPPLKPALETNTLIPLLRQPIPQGGYPPEDRLRLRRRLPLGEGRGREAHPRGLGQATVAE
jgi:hypothetical protein